MTLASGARLGTYEIVSLLGAGGMGEVYRARDPRLGREVAIKVLPEAFARDTEKLARFEREARVLASLNHPGIAAIHGFEQAGGTPFLVMELVEGETLKGPLPPEEAIAISRQICEALEAAHEKGVVHRDLKPANIKITPQGKVKLLDFGLAKAFAEDRTASDPAQSPTVSLATQAGVILGTAAYMSPEQARGRTIDRRTDIWAFGCVLYEMLSGRQAFRGTNVAEIIAAVMRGEPDWSALPAATPPHLRRLLERCLQKDSTERLHDIADARLELKEAPATVPLPAARPARALAWMIAATLFAAIALVLGLVHFRETPPEQQVVRLPLLPPEKTSFGEVDVSPDGRRVAFTARDASGSIHLWVRPLDAPAAQMLGGTEGASFPFWSPDSRWIGFFADGKLKKAEVSGAPPQTIANAPVGRGGAWNRDGVILFAPNVYSPLAQVPATGGEPKPVTGLDTSHEETSHRWPQFLPDGRRFLYFILAGPEHQGIYAGSLDSKEKTLLLASQYSAAYGMGHLLFVRERALLAQRFDAGKLQLAGESLPVAEPVGTTLFRTRASLSETGVLVYYGAGTAGVRLQWFDRGGKALEAVGPPGGYLSVDLSPDGRRLAADRNDTQPGNRDIWLFDLARGASTRFTFRPAFNDSPAWSPDGRRIAFRSNREGAFNLYQKDASGAGEEELLLKTPSNKVPTGWSPDGRWLLYNEQDPKTRMDLWLLRLDGRQPARQPQPWLRTEFDERFGQFSPDGQWVAYDSNESGRHEVYVRPFAAGGAAGAGQSQVSTGGGEQPRWRGDGKELFYLGPDRQLMAVEVKTTGGRFEAGLPRALFPTRAAIIPGLFHTVYAVRADGQRFLILSEGEDVPSQPATVVLNWTAGLK
ncbi:MAG TPA: protein kinase [Bryobacterales bacterium]|nr:protein kinase [Bryobacterales bacterium]